MVNYEAQIGQTPIPYYTTTPSGSRKRFLGLALGGGLIGMNAYYLPIQQDTFVNRAFNVTKQHTEEQIEALKSIAEEVAQNKVSTESKMILQDMGLPADITAITNKCSTLDKSISDPDAVKNLKGEFARNFKKYKKNNALMDNNCAEAFRKIRASKFKWGAGIGLGIGLVLGLITSRN